MIPNATFIRRKRNKGMEIGRVARWAGKEGEERGYNMMWVVNEDRKKCSECTFLFFDFRVLVGRFGELR